MCLPYAEAFSAASVTHPVDVVRDKESISFTPKPAEQPAAGGITSTAGQHAACHAATASMMILYMVSYHRES